MLEVHGVHHRREVAVAFVTHFQSAPYDETNLPLSLRREPDNPHDPNAIAVDALWVENRWHWFRRRPQWIGAMIGYLPAYVAAQMAKISTTEPIAFDFYDCSVTDEGHIYIRGIVLVHSGGAFKPSTRKPKAV